ncbi:hypothetical protein C0J08_14530 [Marinomonas sp. CT5]|uniref:hypothetical protein n=1 Tax=Marinomonas sp. CT5 TaxID=2066133 RepID=UPI001BAEFECA|nr:hypothetical protein [Marinomonas sp. CT5]QUX96539.1 hypothetical protein C0J08_14530 [Marinomonas sp. CT5]
MRAYVRFIVGLCLVWLLMPFAAYATDVVAVDDGGFIAMIVNALPALVELLPAWVGVLYAVAHAVAMLPTRMTVAWPSWLKSLINLLAANYGKAKNKDG